MESPLAKIWKLGGRGPETFLGLCRLSRKTKAGHKEPKLRVWGTQCDSQNWQSKGLSAVITSPMAAVLESRIITCACLGWHSNFFPPCYWVLFLWRRFPCVLAKLNWSHPLLDESGRSQIDREYLNGLHSEWGQTTEINGNKDGPGEVVNIYQTQQHAGYKLLVVMRRCRETPMEISKHTIGESVIRMTLHCGLPETIPVYASCASRVINRFN